METEPFGTRSGQGSFWGHEPSLRLDNCEGSTAVVRGIRRMWAISTQWFGPAEWTDLPQLKVDRLCAANDAAAAVDPACSVPASDVKNGKRPTVALGNTSPIVDVVSNSVISRLTQGVAVMPVRIIDAKGETRFAHLTHVDHGMSSMSHFFAGAASSRFHQPPPSAWNKAAVSA